MKINKLGVLGIEWRTAQDGTLDHDVARLAGLKCGINHDDLYTDDDPTPYQLRIYTYDEGEELLVAWFANPTQARDGAALWLCAYLEDYLTC